MAVKQRYVGLIWVRQKPLQRSRARLSAGNLTLDVAIGRSGMRVDKREGDGATPIGTFALGRLWLRPDAQRHQCALPVRMTRKDDIWCDAPDHRLYNQPAKLPFPASHEVFWREDDLYHAVIEVEWNRRPAIKGRGSAIFLHLARAGLLPTAGCVAVQRKDLARLLARIGRNTQLRFSR